ncbi:hypothetical protein D3C73_1015420 [compost metagenome]
MGFAVLADETVRPDQHAGVEQLHPVSFGQAGDQVNAVLSGERYPQAQAWTVRHAFGMRERILAVVEKIARAGQLRQDNKVGATCDRLFGQLQAAMQIVLAIADANLWVELHDCYTNRACWLAHSDDLFLLLFTLFNSAFIRC